MTTQTVTTDVARIDDLLPQTQCRQCGFDGCLAYARAIVEDGVAINRCAPGGAATNSISAFPTKIKCFPRRRSSGLCIL